MTGEERREQLIRAATAIFSQKGFSGATTKEIAAKACVNEALIFRHFEGKDALYEAVIAERFAGLRADSRCDELKHAAESRNDHGVFRSAGEMVMHRYRSERDIIRILIYGILENRTTLVDRFERELSPLGDFLVDYIKQRQDEGVFLEMEPQPLVFGFFGMVTHHATVGELIGKQEKLSDAKEALDLYASIILKSLRISHDQ